MRTTITLDETLVATLKRKAAEKKIPFKTLIHQTLNLGLEAMETNTGPENHSVTKPRSLKQKPGYDLDALGQIADEFEDEARMYKQS